MLRRWSVLLLLGVLFAGLAPAGRADDEEEPTFAGKKLSYWLAQLTEGKDAKTRRRGVIGVEQIGHEKSRKVVPALVKAVREDKDAEVRTAAARAVGRAVAKALEQARADKVENLPRFDDARDALSTALRTDRADGVREAAAAALGDIGPDARNAVGALALVLKDKNAAIVKAAAEALRRMGRFAREAEKELLQLAGDRKADVDARIEATIALGQCNPEAATTVPVLKDLVADTKSDVRLRRAAADALGKLGKEAAEASATLGIVLISKDSPTELRLAAVTALDQFGSDAKVAIPALVKAVGDEDRFVRVLAMHALGRMGKELDAQRKDAVRAILRATDDSNVEVCVASIETLATLAGEGLGGEAEEVVKRLKTILTREGRKAIREAAQTALDKIQPKKKD